MILAAQHIRAFKPITPFHERTTAHGMSFGLSPAGYDVRVAESMILPPGGFELASTIERFDMPVCLLGIVHDKSTLARLGIALQNTVIEPGWHGYLTLEISNHGNETVHIPAGMPIAQIIFHSLTADTEQPYIGKYQDQQPGPQPAILVVEEPSTTDREDNLSPCASSPDTDCTYLYFKPGGKWKYEGRGRFPRQQQTGWREIDRDEVIRENGGMPGISSRANDLVVVIIPDEDCDVQTAYPRMLHPEQEGGN